MQCRIQGPAAHAVAGDGAQSLQGVANEWKKFFFWKLKKISAVITARGAAEEVLRRGSKIDTALILR